MLATPPRACISSSWLANPSSQLNHGGTYGPILGPEPGPELRIRRVMTTEQRAAVVAFSQAVTHFLHIIPCAEVNLSFQPYPGGEFQRVASAGGGKGGTGGWPAKVWNRAGTGVESDASAKMFASSKRKTAPCASGTGRDPKRPNPNYPVEEDPNLARQAEAGSGTCENQGWKSLRKCWKSKHPELKC